MEKVEPSKKTKSGCAIATVVIFLFIVWQCSQPSEAERLEAEQTELANKAAEKETARLQKESDSLDKIPLKDIVSRAYIDMNARFSDQFVVTNKNNMEALLIRAKGTEYDKRVSKTIDSLTKIIQKVEDNLASDERKNMETTLRNGFLDNNLNIKVKVSGPNNTNMVLSYSLFNEVWFRKFETEGYFDNLNNKGFKKITLTDNYDYTQWMTYK